ncbi:MAG: response regulator [Gloeomargaritaceae cyanobacterium C42_A2020_066]|nr:response regulator [Gloeomargaritaceae cyanobacterium C42_A2020_066]
MSTVLVVEDSDLQREIIVEVLKEGGLDVLIAKNGAEALQKLTDKVPDLVIMDIVMPGMNGYELARHIRKDNRTKDLPLIMCSSKGEDFDRSWGLRQGADAYITKPFEPQDLLGTVRSLLKGNRNLSV